MWHPLSGCHYLITSCQDAQYNFDTQSTACHLHDAQYNKVTRLVAVQISGEERRLIMNSVVITQVVEKLQTLPENLQRRVLVFVQTLQTAAPSGVPGKQLLRFISTIPLDDLELMTQAIETGCGQVDPNEW
jgi:hypothetical protein